MGTSGLGSRGARSRVQASKQMLRFSPAVCPLPSRTWLFWGSEEDRQVAQVCGRACLEGTHRGAQTNRPRARSPCLRLWLPPPLGPHLRLVCSGGHHRTPGWFQAPTQGTLGQGGGPPRGPASLSTQSQTAAGGKEQLGSRKNMPATRNCAGSALATQSPSS